MRAWWVGVALVGCAARFPATGAGRAEVPLHHEREPSRYRDRQLGFELVRPSANWQLRSGGEVSPEGVAIPVMLRHELTGAQVVLEVAPAVATPSQYAERLSVGLKNQPGFLSGDPEPVPAPEEAVGFGFASGEVEGKVAVFPGSEGRVFVLLGTWPSSARQAASEVDSIFRSVRPAPQGH